MNDLTISDSIGGNSVASLLEVDTDSDFPIDGRELHKALGVDTEYRHWFPRMCEYGFQEGKDFRSKMTESTGGRPGTNHDLTISMAKEISMIQRTQKGKEIRQYLIRVEEAWNSPEQVMARALRVADKTIAKLHSDIAALEAENQIMLPKADYFDDLVDRNLNTNFRTTAKEFQIGEKKFIRMLEKHGYIYKDYHGNRLPYAARNNGLFVVKECKGAYSSWAGTQTLITPKGRETFRLLVKQWKNEED